MIQVFLQEDPARTYIRPLQDPWHVLEANRRPLEAPVNDPRVFNGNCSLRQKGTNPVIQWHVEQPRPDAGGRAARTEHAAHCFNLCDEPALSHYCLTPHKTGSGCNHRNNIY